MEAVGELTVEAPPELATSTVVRGVANRYEGEYDREGDETRDAIRAVARNWGMVEKELQEALQWVREEGFDQHRHGAEPIRTDQDLHVSFQHRLFDASDVIGRTIDLSEYSTAKTVVIEELRKDNALPSGHDFQVGEIAPAWAWSITSAG